jgi:hypothetical protein
LYLARRFPSAVRGPVLVWEWTSSVTGVFPFADASADTSVAAAGTATFETFSVDKMGTDGLSIFGKSVIQFPPSLNRHEMNPAADQRCSAR